MENSLLRQVEKYCHHLEILFHVKCTAVDYEKNKLYFQSYGAMHLCKTCEKHLNSECHGRKAFFRGPREAYRWDGVYIYYCNLEMVLVSVFISGSSGDLAGGIVAGPLCMGNSDDILTSIPHYDLRKLAFSMPCYSPEEIQSLAEVMLPIASYISGAAHGKAGRYFYSQETLLNNIYAEKIKCYSETDYYTYPILQEKALRSAIRSCDRDQAENVLNQILAYIYVAYNSDLEAIKPRIAELLIVISRSAVDAGADMSDVDPITQNSMKQLDKFKTIEDMSAWISTVMHRFIETAFHAEHVLHADTIHKVKQYIQTHFQEKITLDHIAAQVNLSKNYLCHIYKKETGETIINYINRLRIEKSRLLFSQENLEIVDIANLCGFEDQSYFTKIFKSYVGMTPKKYRENNQNFV